MMTVLSSRLIAVVREEAPRSLVPPLLPLSCQTVDRSTVRLLRSTSANISSSRVLRKRVSSLDGRTDWIVGRFEAHVAGSVAISLTCRFRNTGLATAWRGSFSDVCHQLPSVIILIAVVFIVTELFSFTVYIVLLVKYQLHAGLCMFRYCRN